MIPQVGQTIELLEMLNDPHPIPVGEKGKVTSLNPLRNGEVQIGVEWESGRRLFLLYPVDKFKIIK